LQPANRLRAVSKPAVLFFNVLSGPGGKTPAGLSIKKTAAGYLPAVDCQ